MTKMEKLLESLPEYDLKDAKAWLENHPEEVPADEDEAVEKLIFNISWEYKYRAESAPIREGGMWEKRKAKLYDKWKKLGLVD
ncbi:hypothetical protein [Anaerovibrio sp. RM50]|uniref:hypothetical protein n=1 Tax=Anaerovibrio sp. RM50 TaxID=1200557 RepID=UPI000480A6F5|nr:hypothetical protein [Anaerovibrio sp. RM50]